MAHTCLQNLSPPCPFLLQLETPCPPPPLQSCRLLRCGRRDCLPRHVLHPGPRGAMGRGRVPRAVRVGGRATGHPPADGSGTKGAGAQRVHGAVQGVCPHALRGGTGVPALPDLASVPLPLLLPAAAGGAAGMGSSGLGGSCCLRWRVTRGTRAAGKLPERSLYKHSTPQKPHFSGSWEPGRGLGRGLGGGIGHAPLWQLPPLCLHPILSPAPLDMCLCQPVCPTLLARETCQGHLPSQPVLRGTPCVLCPQHPGPARRASSRVPTAAALPGGGSAMGTTTVRMALTRYSTEGRGSLPTRGSGDMSHPVCLCRWSPATKSGLRAWSWLQPRPGLSLLTAVPSPAERLHATLRVRPVPVQEWALHPHALALRRRCGLHGRHR